MTTQLGQHSDPSEADAAGRAELARFHGQLVDIDSHEMVPSGLWRSEFGPVADVVRPFISGIFEDAAENTMSRDDITGDDMAIDYDSVWNVKGPDAPSAIDLSRRPAVLDAMGISRQLVYPSFGLTGLRFVYDPMSPAIFNFDPSAVDRVDVGRQIIAAHNGWAARKVREVDGYRVRPVGILDTSDFDQLIRDAEGAVETGLRALWIPGTIPPGGTSPGDTKLDPFWKLMADSDVAVTLHIGTEFGLLASTRWGNGVPQFTPATGSALEFPIEPYRSSTLHLTPSNFLAAMILGGVFERHPGLRFGVIECAAHWVGPLAEQLDLWSEEFNRRLSAVLSMRPSEYLARNVRVTPFCFEPVDTYFERFPDLADVFCYSSDFPHREGGKESALMFMKTLLDTDPALREKFFVSNGAFLVP